MQDLPSPHLVDEREPLKAYELPKTLVADGTTRTDRKLIRLRREANPSDIGSPDPEITSDSVTVGIGSTRLRRRPAADPFTMS